MPPTLSRRFHCSGILDQPSNLSLGQPAQQQLKYVHPSPSANQATMPSPPASLLQARMRCQQPPPTFPSCKPSKPAGSHVAKHHTTGQLQTLISRNLKYVFIRPPPRVFLLQPRLSGPSTTPPLSYHSHLSEFQPLLYYLTVQSGSHVGADRIASPRQSPGRERELLWHPSPIMLTASRHKSAPFDW